MIDEDRRREPRLNPSSASFIIQNIDTSPSTPCTVLNLSRLGIGVDIASQNLQNNLTVGASLRGKLTVGQASLDVATIIRVQKGTFLGLEYDMSNSSFLKELYKTLSPAYIASSITAISSEYLGHDIDSAFRGDDFECVIFKPSKFRPDKVVQIVAGDNIIEITSKNIRFVPAPLIRISSTIGGFDFLSEFENLSTDTSEQKMMKFLLWLENIIDQWQTCPADIKTLVKEKIATLHK